MEPNICSSPVVLSTDTTGIFQLWLDNTTSLVTKQYIHYTSLIVRPFGYIFWRSICLVVDGREIFGSGTRFGGNCILDCRSHCERLAMNSVPQDLLQAAANTIEKVVDEKLEKLDNLSEEDILSIRKKRLAELKKKAEERREYLRLGHGTVEEIGEEREFFNIGKRSKRVIYCFYRPGTSRYTDDLVELLKKVASTHIESKFVLVNAEKSPFLTNKLKIYILPTLVLFMDGKKVKTFAGLDEITEEGKLSVDRLVSCLKDYQMLQDTFEE